MSDKFDTLHPKGDPSVNIYPNINPNHNIPDSSIPLGKLSENVQKPLYIHHIFLGLNLDNGYHAIILEGIPTTTTSSRLTTIDQIINFLNNNGFNQSSRKVGVHSYSIADTTLENLELEIQAVRVVDNALKLTTRKNTEIDYVSIGYIDDYVLTL